MTVHIFQSLKQINESFENTDNDDTDIYTDTDEKSNRKTIQSLTMSA